MRSSDSSQRRKTAEVTPDTRNASAYFPFGFPLSRAAWDRYGIERIAGHPAGPDDGGAVYRVRQLAERMNEFRARQAGPNEPAVRAGELLAMGLVQDALRAVIDFYCADQVPGVLGTARDWLRARYGLETADDPPTAFANLYPPWPCMASGLGETEYLMDSTAGRPNQDIVTAELILLALAVDNPAMAPFTELFDDTELREAAPYPAFVKGLDTFFDTQPPVDVLGGSLFECLRAPMRQAPDSLTGQLDYIRAHWSGLMPEGLLGRVYVVEGIVREETAVRLPGPGPAEILSFGHGGAGAAGPVDDEPECFSEDADWMSNVVLLAKSVYVWLDQLSKRYGRWIRRLDEVPDEELDRLARWGFNAIWLIGVWERSHASERIKRMTGNREAAASAYSIYDYEVAGSLGGEGALQNLHDRALHRGIRLASDMVPNHMGLFSKWVVEHPDWFVQLDTPPYPGYRFTGEDLSDDPRVALRIEDGYWDRRDAAVVFQREDRATGEVRYIYHGNDGTSMPWNDTAQLNYLLPEVREAVIQTILHVARTFPIIRFDAAMTLTRRHYQRLWFPKPGDAGAVPSRAEHGLTREELCRQMPQEFWREVVDRIAQEAPDTLLLAEAFWLMEGYFVRTLGMHRVYNSAFMNMLKMEDNANYRTTVKNVLEFSPEVLKRFVNFMSNPDEATAAEQFGKGEKYYGAACMMVTMPGLPMFGHGQVEGFTEKYGMEYRRAYWDERVDDGMLRRHEAEIFPLMQRRRIFSGVENFAFYDFRTPDGHVDENVFAYSNRAGLERAIVLYNNAYRTTSGRIQTSTAINVGTDDSENLIHKTLAESLALRTDSNRYYLFRNHRDGLEYIESGLRLAQEGLAAELAPYECRVLVDFREIEDHDGIWQQLAAHLAGRGVADVESECRALVLAPLLDAFRNAINGASMKQLADPALDPATAESVWEGFAKGMRRFVAVLEAQSDRPLDPGALLDATRAWLDLLRGFDKQVASLDLTKDEQAYLLGPVRADGTHRAFWRIPTAWAMLEPLGRAMARAGQEGQPSRWMDEWLLTVAVKEAFMELGREDWLAKLDAELVGIVIRYLSLLPAEAGPESDAVLRTMLDDPMIRDYLFVHRFDGVLWLNKEQLENMLYWMFFLRVLELCADASADPAARSRALHAHYATIQRCLALAAKAHYELERLLEPPPPDAAP
ncbi:MAG: alpha-amylase [Candidatus Hydrogenedentes bacterium]|nr:alpha-amylase [Candidatus Hydrogenedentota bacterium]